MAWPCVDLEDSLLKKLQCINNYCLVKYVSSLESAQSSKKYLPACKDKIQR